MSYTGGPNGEPFGDADTAYKELRNELHNLDLWNDQDVKRFELRVLVELVCSLDAISYNIS